jgi:hypothetical protein
VVDVRFLRSGQQAAGDGTIFPICKLKDDDTLRLIGTGFFIATNGLFVTAEHVLRGEAGPLYVAHFLENGEYYLRHVMRASLSSESDFAVGALLPMTSKTTGEMLKNTILNLSAHVPAVGETISTFAYPETEMHYGGSPSSINFVSNWYHGTVSDVFPQGAALLKSPAVAAHMQSLGGCSGGPVFSPLSGGGVIGINSAGVENEFNMVSLTSALLDVSFFDVTVEGQHYPHITVQQLVDLRHVLLSSDN